MRGFESLLLRQLVASDISLATSFFISIAKLIAHSFCRSLAPPSPNRIHCVWLRFGAAHRSPELFAGGLFPQTERTAHGRSSFFHMYHHFRARTGSGSTLRVCRISSQTVVCLKKLPMVMGEPAQQEEPIDQQALPKAAVPTFSPPSAPGRRSRWRTPPSVPRSAGSRRRTPLPRR